MIRLRPFKRQDAEKILPWLSDERTMAMWSGGHFHFPLTKEQLLNRMEETERLDDAWIMAGLDEQGEVAGHLYMWADYEKNSLHFGFIVVDDTRRGQGLGQQLLKSAVKYAFDILGVERVTLGVFDSNPRAHGCYKKVGFRDEYVEENAYNYHGEMWNRQLMAIERER